jgi:hypothetical protein
VSCRLCCCYLKQLHREISFGLNHLADRSHWPIGASAARARRPAFAIYGFVVERAALREL